MDWFGEQLWDRQVQERIASLVFIALGVLGLTLIGYVVLLYAFDALSYLVVLWWGHVLANSSFAIVSTGIGLLIIAGFGLALLGGNE